MIADESSVDLTPGVIWTDSQLVVVRDLLAKLRATEAERDDLADKVAAGLALADELDRQVTPRSFHPAGTHSDGASQAFADAAARIRRALGAPLTTATDEENR